MRSLFFFIVGVGLLFSLNIGFANNGNISYLHKDIPYHQISTVKTGWKPFKNKIQSGFLNGVYWFKLDLPPSKNERILRIPESHITRTQLFLNNTSVPLLSPNNYVTYKIPALNKQTIYYLKVNCLLEARIPIELLSIEEYYENKSKDYNIMAFYYAIVVLIILFNLFSYFSIKNITYLHYIFMVLGMALNSFYKDGLVALLLGFNGLNEVLELYISFVLVVASVFFVKSYLDRNNTLFKMRRIGIIMVIISFVFVVLFHITRHFYVFVIAHILELLTISFFWFYGVILWTRSVYARFFTIAYGLPLFIAYDYYFSPYFGFSIFNTSNTLYKIGSIFEMLIFTYAIMYFVKHLAIQQVGYRFKIIEYASKIKELSLVKTKLKTTEELISPYNFTATEIKILLDLVKGDSNKTIANSHFISENTVKFHVKNIYTKFKVKSRKEARLKFNKLTFSSQ